MNERPRLFLAFPAMAVKNLRGAADIRFRGAPVLTSADDCGVCGVCGVSPKALMREKRVSWTKLYSLDVEGLKETPLIPQTPQLRRDGIPRAKGTNRTKPRVVDRSLISEK